MLRQIFCSLRYWRIVDENVIEKSKFKIIMGAANNQLKASAQEEEYRLARLLAQRNIVFQCDWVHNVAGVLAGWEEYRNQEKADIKNIITRIETLCKDNTWNNLQRAKDLNLTPTEIAYKEAEKLIYQ